MKDLASKALIIMLAVIFIIVSLGVCDVEIEFVDDTKFTYRSWLHWFINI